VLEVRTEFESDCNYRVACILNLQGGSGIRLLRNLKTLRNSTDPYIIIKETFSNGEDSKYISCVESSISVE